MANKEHLKIFAKGVVFWNKWRSKNTLLFTDLSEIGLIMSRLKGINFEKTDLRNTNLSYSKISMASLIDANLSGSILDHAIIEKSKLNNANLYGANLSFASLKDSDLTNTILSNSNLINSKFIGSILIGSLLTGVNLHDANFSGANLQNAKLNDSKLIQTNFMDADLENADLTGVTFFRVITFGWNIKGVKCDYIYLDQERTNRYPKDRNFKPGEFESLYRTVPTIEYVFEHGMKWIDALLMDQVSIELQKEQPNLGIQLLSIDGKGIKPKAVFSILAKEYADSALEEITTRYESKMLKLENERDTLRNLLIEAINQPRKHIYLQSGDYYESHGDMQIYNIQITQAIEEINDIVKKEPEESFKKKSKKEILEILHEILRDSTKEGIKGAAKKVYELAKSELAPLLPKIAGQVAVLESLKHLF